MKIRYWALAAVLIAVPAVAVAHEHGEGRGPGRPELDADGNLTLDAARAASAERLKVMDKNGDGVLTPDETPRLFDRPDADGDGKITAAELAATDADLAEAQRQLNEQLAIESPHLDRLIDQTDRRADRHHAK